jgi:predicted ATP-grasp superfamily ATP-dependent carboligase
MSGTTAFVLTHESDPNRRLASISLIALAITRSLGRQGIPVVRVHPNWLDRSLDSRYCRAVEICPDFYASEDALVRFLMGLAERYPGKRVLVPASDDCACFIARNHAQLSLSFLVLAPPDSVMRDILDKQRQYEFADRVGVPIPETYFPTSLEEVLQLAPKLTGYPYVIKPTVAHAWRLASQKGVSKGRKGVSAMTPEELVTRYDELAHGESRLMIQEVIGGADERLFTFLAYCNEAGEPLAWCIRKKLRQFPVDFGYCTLTVSCHDDTVLDQSLRLLRALRFHGLCGVEWKLDPRTGIYKLIEVNPRAVNTTAIAAACGVDLPAIAVLDKSGDAPAPASPPEWADGVKWINGEQDFWAARTLMKRGQLTLSAWRRSIAGPKVHAAYSADDLGPFVNQFGGIVHAMLGRLWQRLRPSRKPVRLPEPAIVRESPSSQGDIAA